jgi:DNA-binding NarL/FixJ family response regulator
VFIISNEVAPNTTGVLRQALSYGYGYNVVGRAYLRSFPPDAIDRLDRADPDVVVVLPTSSATDGLRVVTAVRAQRPDQAIVVYTAEHDDPVDTGRLGRARCGTS